MEHFKKLGCTGFDESKQADRLISDCTNEYINDKFSIEEIKQCVKKLKAMKACGVDNIHNEFLKNCPTEIIMAITDFFNIVLDTRIVPTEWTIGLIIPLYKNKGAKSDPDCYRGITLLSCMGKLFTAVVNDRLANFLNATGTIGDEQAGFRPDHSTVDHIFTLHCIIDFYLQKKQRLYCAFIDYRKAFDLVSRSNLWVKLLKSGINGKILSVIQNLYAAAKSCVMIGDAISQSFPCNIGVRQGENLSPLLFAIYLNDFEFFVSRQFGGLKNLSSSYSTYLSDDTVEVFLKLYVLLYADDTIVMAETKEELQKALDAVSEYCKMWELQVNTSKTKIVIFSKGKIRNIPAFTFDENPLEVCDDYVYLGTTFNYNGSFSKAMNKQVVQARKATFVLMKKNQCLQLSIDVQCELFDQMIAPILLYGSEVWGFANVEVIEKFHRWFLKYILKLSSRTPNPMVYGETGRTELILMIKYRMVNFWAKLASGSTHKLSNCMYKLMHAMHFDRACFFSSSWIDSVKSTLDSCGMSHVWHTSPGEMNRLWLKKALKLRLNDIFHQKWNMMLNDNSRCTNYRIFKDSLNAEDYLIKLDAKERICLSRYRCRNIRLPISNESANAQKCSLCNKEDLGDEFHYIMDCEFFKTERLKLLGNLAVKNTMIFKRIMNPSDIAQQKKLSKFVLLISQKMSVKMAPPRIPSVNINIGTSTRSGRRIKRPVILDL